MLPSIRHDQNIAAKWLQPLPKAVGKKVYNNSISLPSLLMVLAYASTPPYAFMA
jgi:hypothetical protein